jgi:hypothetical protein
MALFLFLVDERDCSALALTETIYTIPEGSVELIWHEEYSMVEHYYRKEHIGLGFGIVPDISIWFKFEYLHDGAFEMGQGEIGDTFLKFFFYIGDYFDDILHLGWMVQFRFPTGKNAYTSTEWRNLCLGNSEIRLGPVARLDVIKKIFFHFNLFYTFRQDKGENFWGGFHINPVDEDTYIKLFGLNPFSDNTFLNVDRLKNDYISLALACNTNVIYPVIPYIEIYGSFRPYRGYIETEDIPIEGAGIDPFLISTGIRYFFKKYVYLGFYAVLNPLIEYQDGYLAYTLGFDFSIQF